MEEMKINRNIEDAEIFATKTISRTFSNRLVFHDVRLVKRVVKAVEEIGIFEKIGQEDIDNLKIAAWLSQLGHGDNDNLAEQKDPKSYFVACFDCTIKTAKSYLGKSNLKEEDREKVLKILEESAPFTPIKYKLSKILDDALNVDWGRKKGRRQIEKLYEELLLLNSLSISKSGWLEKAIEYLNNHTYHTDFAVQKYKPRKDQLILKLEKEKKDFSKTENLAIKQELGITEDELKSLKKSLKSVKGRDERGIQTMFRSTSKNHYTLNQMVDRKANIMISINAIILSLVLSRFIGDAHSTFCIHNSPILVILVCAIISIFFAIFAIIPIKTHGSFSENEIRNKKGNLLYFGNYHNMAFRDYEWGILQMLNDSNYLYISMIRDQYFLGKTINRKHNLIRVSLGAFLIGFVLAVALFLIVSSMPDYHFGGVNH